MGRVYGRGHRGAVIVRLPAVALETSLQSPAAGPADRQRDLRLDRPARLGLGRGPGRADQPPPGADTVFLTLRDTVADISVPLTCARTLFDGLDPPLVEGAGVVVHARPSFYANRGTLSLYAREIRMVGLGELLARLERRRQLLAAEGLFAPELKRPLPFLPARGRAGHRAQLRRRARRGRERPAPLARGRASRSRTPRCRASAPPPR